MRITKITAYPITIIVSIILSISFISCEDENLEQEMLINYGISSGSCMGYCIQELHISPDKSTYLKQSWNTANPNLTYHLTNIENAKQSLYDAIDLDAFIELPTVVGCPDCADKGAEWIEIVQGDFHHKVTFEYNNEPDTLNTYIGTLRMLLSDAQKRLEK